jgi:hypothetical protein
MIGLWQAYSTNYLYVVAVGTLLLFGVPLLLWPLNWAKVLGWQIPDHTHLAIYFGRCLGGVICAMGGLAFVAAASVVTQRFFFYLIMANFTAMIVIHIYGAVKKLQPISETYEIIYWVLMLGLTALFYPIG